MPFDLPAGVTVTISYSKLKTNWNWISKTTNMLLQYITNCSLLRQILFPLTVQTITLVATLCLLKGFDSSEIRCFLHLTSVEQPSVHDSQLNSHATYGCILDGRDEWFAAKQRLMLNWQIIRPKTLWESIKVKVIQYRVCVEACCDLWMCCFWGWRNFKVNFYQEKH